MTLRVFLGKTLYHCLGKHMPCSYSRFSFGSRRVRAFCGRLILRSCGKNVNIEKGAEFPAAISLGDNSGIGINCVLSAEITIGRDVMMGPDCMMYTGAHGMGRTDVPMRLQKPPAIRPIVIGSDVWIGARVIILPGVHVGDGSVIGAGSVVTKDVAPYSVVAGNPARLIRTRGQT